MPPGETETAAAAGSRGTGHAAATGDALIAPNVTVRLLAAFASAGPAPKPAQPIAPLTDREEQILLAVAAGRTNREIGDAMYITLSTVKSHQDRRDQQFQGRIMEVSQYPNPTFPLTRPTDLGSAPAVGAKITAKATGTLKLKNAEKEVTFDVTAEQQNGRIGVLGAIPVVFADYDVPNPSTGGISTDDNGLLEFVLVFEPA